MIKYSFLFLLISTWKISAAQGCVAIRNSSLINSHILFDYDQQGRFFLNMGSRYLEAAETFRGEEFITDTLVRNRLFTINLVLTRILKNGWSLSLNLPVSANSRENSGDHGGPKTPKYMTSSYGLGDIRISANKWLWDPGTRSNSNIQLGLGLKFPTGDYNYSDYFTRNDSTRVLAPVDQAIQLGDGGLGITLELNGFYSLSNNVRLFASGFYLINPREQNGVSNLKGRSPSAAEINNYTTVMSVPDQFILRGGASVEYQKMALSTALRFEKIPVKDLIGGNKGFRRSASITSIEPGISYRIKNHLAYLYIGIPFKRSIVLNHQNNMTPAGFANFIFTLGAGFRL